MSQNHKENSGIKKSNIIAVVLIAVALVYIWKTEQTPKPPLDRTVASKSSTGVMAPQKTSSQDQESNTPATITTTSESATTTEAPPSAEPEMENTNALEDIDGATPPNPSPASTAPSLITGDLTSSDTQTGSMASGSISYYNNYLEYGLSLPKGSYYAGYGGQDGAAHTMGFTSGTGVTSFEEAQIKLWYYPNKLLPELKNGENSFYQDPSTNMTYLKLGNGTIRLNGNMEDPILLKILETVHRAD